MKRKEQSVLLAGLLALGLAACTTGGMSGRETASTTQSDVSDTAYGTESATGTGTGTMGSSGTVADTGRTSEQSTSSTGGTGSMAGTGTGSMTGTGQNGTAGSMAGTGQSGTTGAMTGTGQSGTAMAPNSVVTLIEVVPRQSGAGAGTMAGSAVGGTGAGATGTADRVYRITLRMDDGTTRMITQEWAPTFRTGDRVNVTGGEIQRR